MEIRAEVEADRAAVRALNRAAFDSDAGADLVDALRKQADPCISLVAEEAGKIAGHIMFSPALVAADTNLRAMALGPMAVLPARQGKGIGTALVKAGLEQCQLAGCVAVFVLGHARYYPRFGFVPASRFGISSVYNVPDEVFMALELDPGALTDKAGKMHYHSAFAGL